MRVISPPRGGEVRRLSGYNPNSLAGVLGDLLLLLLSACLFGLSFPNVFFISGVFPLAFVALVPLFVVINRCNWLQVFLYAPLYGWGCYALFNYWLSTFHPLAIVIVPSIYAVYHIALLPLLKLCSLFFPRYGYLAQLIVWIGYEFLRTKGFLGYPYGILGYSQHNFLPFIQSADLLGVWLTTLLVLLPNVYLGASFGEGLGRVRAFFSLHRWTGLSFALLLAGNLIYGGVSLLTDYSVDGSGRELRRIKAILVQHNADSWEGGFRAYRRNVETLIRLSDEALKREDGVDLVVWSETSVVPGIDWHTRYRQDPLRYQLIERLTDYLSKQDVPFIFGNDDGQAVMDEDGNPILDEGGALNRVDYNAVIHFSDGKIQDTYRKLHLVPFTEHFPYEDIFPQFYDLLVANDYNFWERGSRHVLFDVDGIKVFTPICFEDVFGYLSREFVLRGAELIVNLSNDSWSKSAVAEVQHATMAVFRAIENRRSVIRSTNSGITCAILPNGKLTAQLEPFVEATLSVSLPIYTEKTTLYTRVGDLLGWFGLFGGLVLLLTGGIIRLVSIIGQNSKRVD